MSGVMCRRVAMFVLGGLLASSLIAAEPKARLVPREVPKLVGRWQRTSASYQTAGSEAWQFSADGTLTKESKYYGNKSAVAKLPVRVIRKEHRYEVDASQKPSRLTTFVVDERGEKKVVDRYAFEFHDAELWICRDYGEEIKPGTLQAGGECSWLMGFKQLKKE